MQKDEFEADILEGKEEVLSHKTLTEMAKAFGARFHHLMGKAIAELEKYIEKYEAPKF